MRGGGAPERPFEADPELDRDVEELDEEERARRFMEALGMPTGAPRPERVEPRHRLAEPPPLPPAPPEPARSVKPTPPPVRKSVPSPSPTAQQDDFWNRQKIEMDHFTWGAEVATPEAMRLRAEKERNRQILSKAESEALARIEQQSAREPWGSRKTNQKNASASLSGSSFRSLVADPQAARRAILAKEILDQPRGLQSLPGPITILDS